MGEGRFKTRTNTRNLVTCPLGLDLDSRVFQMAQPLNKIPGTVRLAKLLTHLNASPKLALAGVKRMKLSYAMENDHFGARSVAPFFF
jgi:hypothetical protein